MLTSSPKNFRKREDFPNNTENDTIPLKRLRYFDHTTTLPDEILVYIFSFQTLEQLYRSTRCVCKRWYVLASSPLLWKRISVENEVPSDTLCGWIERSPLLKELTLKGRSDIDLVTEKLSKFCRKLESLKIENSKGKKKSSFIQSKHLCNLLTKCKFLNTIHFSGVKIQSCRFFKLLSVRKHIGLNRRCSYSGPVNSKQIKTLIESIITSNIYEAATLFTSNNRKISLKNYYDNNNNYSSLADTVNRIWEDINSVSQEYDPMFDDDDNDDYNYLPLRRHRL